MCQQSCRLPDRMPAYWHNKRMSFPIFRKNLKIHGISRSPDLCSMLAASSQGSCLSDIMQLAHTHSDGIVPDLHRVPYESIAGTYSIGKNSQNMNFLVSYTCQLYLSSPYFLIPMNAYGFWLHFLCGGFHLPRLLASFDKHEPVKNTVFMKATCKTENKVL